MRPSLQNQVDLKSLNTMNLSALAEWFFPLTELDNLSELLKSFPKNKPKFILGGGSNIVFSQNYPGLVIHNRLQGIEILHEDSCTATIKVMAGENWHDFVMYCIERGLGGLENLSLIPGTVGAAPIQNIGAYGVEVCDYVESVETVSLTNGEPRIFLAEECQFAYRHSIFKTELNNQYLICSVTFKLHKYPKLNFSYGNLQETIHKMNFKKLSIKVLSQAVINIRKSKLPDPKIIPNTGSFFKNPFVALEQFRELSDKYPNLPSYATSKADMVKIPAAWLIEKSGFKGKKFGNVGVHDKQALVLVNHNNGSADELLSLVNKIQEEVNRNFNIPLQTEVQII